MTSEGNQDWRGGRAPRNSGRQEEAQPSWKQSRNAPAARKRKFGSKLMLLMVLTFLAVLVGTLIWVFRPERQHRTHFVVMNLLQDSANFDAATAVMIDDALSAESASRLVSRSIEQSLKLSALSQPEPSSALLRAHSVVICLQTTIVAGSNGDLQCLVKNSTPDLDDENAWVPFRELRDELILLQKEHGPKHILLIVDTPPTNADWRTGYLTADVRSELESWTTTIEGLAVLLSSSGEQTSEYSVAGSDGQTVFAHFVSCGLSSLADSDGNKDGDLSAAEFCSYVADRTDRWVKQHRNAAGQTVVVLPPVEKLRELKKFLVMRDVPIRAATDEVISAGVSSQIQSELGKLWGDREELASRGGSRWNPLRWTAATDALHRAETATLHGQNENATRAREIATNSLADLKQITNAVCADTASLHSERGLIRGDFEILPSFGRVADLWEPASAPGNAASSRPATAIEDVIGTQLREFQFAAVGLALPTAADLDVVRSRRVLAETAAASLMGCAWRIPATIKRMESELLRSEDRRFTRVEPDSISAAGEPNPDVLIAAIAQFAAAHDAAETTLSRVQDTTPSLAYWSANTEFELSVAESDAWRKLLVQNSVDREMNRSTMTELLDVLSGIAAKDVLGFRGTALQLREESFRLFVHARGLQQSLMLASAEPPTGFTVEQLQQKTREIAAWQTDALSSVNRVSALIEETMTLAIDESPALRPAQLDVARLLRSSLCLSSMTAATRAKVFDRVVKWDEKLLESVATSSTDPSDTAQGAPAPQTSIDDALWTLQILNLLPCSDAQSQQLREAETAIGTLMAAGSPEERRKAIATYGAAVRSVWKLNRENVRKAVQTTSAESHELLRLADQQARLFSAFDAQNPAVRSPTERLRLMNRLQYCLMQTDRLLAGQWLESGDRPPLSVNGWYARTSVAWLLQADECVKKLTTGAAGSPAFAVQAISDLRDRLLASDQLKITVSPEPGPVNLGEQNDDRRSVPAKIVTTNPSSVSGEASLLVLPVTGDGAAGLLSIENNASILSLDSSVESAALDIHRPGNPGGQGCEPVSFTTEVFFRGHRWKSDVTLSVSPCAQAEFIVERLARPETASVKMSGSDPRPIVFILDWSGSMTEKLTGRQTIRSAEALDTLRTLIGRDILTNSRISLNVYGHRVKYNLRTKQHEFNPLYTKVFEKEIPPGLNALLDIEMEFRLRKADQKGKDDFLEVLKKLEQSGPFGTTPLATAITNALTVDLRDKAGIVIAVTDGEATDVGPAAEPLARTENSARQKKLKEAVKGNPASKAVIVAFDFKQNQVERKSLQTIFVDDCGIKVVDAGDKAELLDQILGSLDPRNYFVSRRSDSQRLETPLGETVAGLMPADDYEIRFAQIASRAPVSLDHGDQLNLDIDHRRQRLLFLRAKTPEMKTATLASSATGALPDQPTILRSIAPALLSEIAGAGDSGMKKAELSLMLDHPVDELSVRQPKEIEFSVKPAGLNYQPPMIHQQYNSDNGAPGWLITIDQWPAEQDFLVDAVWKMHRSAPEQVLRWDELRSADNPKAAMSLGGNGLPDCTVWTTLKSDGILQVRLDKKINSVPYAEDNLPEDVRIEIGNRDTLEQNSSFLPREITTRIRTTESGSVIFEFDGNLNAETVANIEIAFTSAAARKAGASEVRELRIDKRR